MIGDQEIGNLHIILVTERCDISYLISYITQADFFIMEEIVFQSSCINRFIYILFEEICIISEKYDFIHINFGITSHNIFLTGNFLYKKCSTSRQKRP